MTATKDGARSISLPALGTGLLGFPEDVVAHIMYETAVDYAKATRQTTLKQITFVVYDMDMTFCK